MLIFGFPYIFTPPLALAQNLISILHFLEGVTPGVAQMPPGVA
jgi:hypothetical protein